MMSWQFSGRGMRAFVDLPHVDLPHHVQERRRRAILQMGDLESEFSHLVAPGENHSRCCVFGATGVRDRLSRSRGAIAPELFRQTTLRIEGAQGMPGAGRTHVFERNWSACNKERRRQSPQV
jgi:hypothetical protein